MLRESESILANIGLYCFTVPPSIDPNKNGNKTTQIYSSLTNLYLVPICLRIIHVHDWIWVCRTKAMLPMWNIPSLYPLKLRFATNMSLGTGPWQNILTFQLTIHRDLISLLIIAIAGWLLGHLYDAILEVFILNIAVNFRYHIIVMGRH